MPVITMHDSSLAASPDVVYFDLKSELLEDPAFDFTEDSRQWVKWTSPIVGSWIYISDALPDCRFLDRDSVITRSNVGKSLLLNSVMTRAKKRNRSAEQRASLVAVAAAYESKRLLRLGQFCTFGRSPMCRRMRLKAARATRLGIAGPARVGFVDVITALIKAIIRIKISRNSRECMRAFPNSLLTYPSLHGGRGFTQISQVHSSELTALRQELSAQAQVMAQVENRPHSPHPHSNDYGTNRVIHHTVGLLDFTQALWCHQVQTGIFHPLKNAFDGHYWRPRGKTSQSNRIFGGPTAMVDSMAHDFRILTTAALSAAISLESGEEEEDGRNERWLWDALVVVGVRWERFEVRLS
ncbi:hypothetical protein ACFX1Q_023451 [Malus domestica]